MPSADTLYIVELPELAGHASHTVFVDDLDGRIKSIGARGTSPLTGDVRNGVRKVIYCDPDGNETGFGGAPVDDQSVLIAAEVTRCLAKC